MYSYLGSEWSPLGLRYTPDERCPVTAKVAWSLHDTIFQCYSFYARYFLYFFSTIVHQQLVFCRHGNSSILNHHRTSARHSSETHLQVLWCTNSLTQSSECYHFPGSLVNRSARQGIPPDGQAPVSRARQGAALLIGLGGPGRVMSYSLGHLCLPPFSFQ